MECAGTLSVGLIGVGTVESVPVYHYHPGGTAVRVRLPLYADHYFRCDEEFDVCLLSKRGSLDPEEVAASWLARAILSFRPDLVVFEGFGSESEVPECLVEELRRHGVTVGFRVFPVRFDAERLARSDLVVVDYPRDYLVDEGLAVDSVRGLSGIAATAKWLELNVYLRDPLDYWAKLSPIVSAAGPDTVIHVHVEHHAGGGAISDMVDWLRRRVRHVYVHNDLYPHRDTLCPSCRAVVATREGAELTGLKAPGGRCWRCGSIIPFHGRIRERTPRALIQATGGLRWVHPRLLRTPSSRDRT